MDFLRIKSGGGGRLPLEEVIGTAISRGTFLRVPSLQHRTKNPTVDSAYFPFQISNSNWFRIQKEKTGTKCARFEALNETRSEIKRKWKWRRKALRQDENKFKMLVRFAMHVSIINCWLTAHVHETQNNTECTDTHTHTHTLAIAKRFTERSIRFETEFVLNSQRISSKQNSVA